MINRFLTKDEYETFVACVNGENFSRTLFKKADSKIRFGAAIRPQGVADLDLPSLPKEWRAAGEWSLEVVDRHQKACLAAWTLYWEIMCPMGTDAHGGEPGGQIVWHKISDVFPPVKKSVLTLGFSPDGSPHITTDELHPGFGDRQDPELFYWASGDDFGDVEYWAELPETPIPTDTQESRQEGVARRFKEYRLYCGKNQKEMAEMLGISIPALQGYEYGKHWPGGNVLTAIAKLGGNTNWILTGHGEILI